MEKGNELVGYVTFTAKRHNYGSEEIALTFKAYDGEKEALRNCTSDPLDDFTVRATIYEAEGGTAARVYTWIEFKDVYRVDLARAGSMLKVLKRVHAALGKMAEEMGYTDDYLETLGRVCAVLKVKRVFFSDDLKVCSMYSERDGAMAQYSHTLSGARARIGKHIASKMPAPAIAA